MNINLFLIILSIVALVCLVLRLSCTAMKNPTPANLPAHGYGRYETRPDGVRLFIYEFAPVSDYSRTIFIIAGITGINENSEKEVIDILASGGNRVVVIHPRGTGYSEGLRGDCRDFQTIIDDYVAIINDDLAARHSSSQTILFGHSMSCALTMAVAEKRVGAAGIILVNPAYKLKTAKGMSPSLWEYLKYIRYFVFAPHTPIVNMAGDPALIENAEDRTDAQIRGNDPLLVRYFSMYMMMQAKKRMDAMATLAARIDLPLLLLYGDHDAIVDKAGCDEIVARWKNSRKQYSVIADGTHGKSTIVKSAKLLQAWLKQL